jgi:hypothetical protein
MKIVFICGSLEPGRDGVGDYTRCLAGELIRQGQNVSIIALNEINLEKSFLEEVQESEGTNISILRLSNRIRYKERFIKAKEWVDKFNPEWLSLQYVPFSFQKKGLPFGLGRRLKLLGKEKRWHIMFHELWVGMENNDIRQEKILGAIQKLFIQLMLAVLKPEKVFTSIRFYADHLNQIGVKTSLAPVFGNIPLGDWGIDEDWDQLSVAAGLSSLHKTPDVWLVLGFFGTVYPCPGLEQLLKNAADAAIQIGRKLGILIIGHGRGQDIREIALDIPGSNCWQTGILSPAMINRSMQLVDMGVVTTSAIGLNKSGTAKAWLERGIPVLISAEDTTYCISELQSKGAYQIVGAADVLVAFKAKGKILSLNRFEEVVAAYSSLDTIATDNINSIYK